MIFGLFGPKNKPSPNQLRLCNDIGLKVTKNMSKDDVSELISSSLKQPKYRERYNKLKGIDEAQNRLDDIEQYGEEIVAQFEMWEKHCGLDHRHLLIYKKGKKVYSDVAELCSVEIVGTTRFKLSMEIALPKKEREMGSYCYNWDKYININPLDILYLEPLHASLNDALEDWVTPGQSEYEYLVQELMFKQEREFPND